MDDVILNEAAAYSKTITENLESMMHSDAIAALKGGGRGRICLIFTPFHYADVNTSAIIGGAYTPCMILPIVYLILLKVSPIHFALWNLRITGHCTIGSWTNWT